MIHPTAATPEKTWPAGFFLELARHLRQELRLAGFYRGPGRRSFAVSDLAVPVAARRCPEVARLLRDAALFVGNDSGPAHIGGCFRHARNWYFSAPPTNRSGALAHRSQILKADPIHRITRGSGHRSGTARIRDCPVDEGRAAAGRLRAPLLALLLLSVVLMAVMGAMTAARPIC